jgi:hypothetical protein
MSKVSFYTVITANKDKIIEQIFPITRFIDSYDRFKDPRRNSRIQKILSHKYFDSEFTVYLDGNRKLLVSPEELVKKYMDGYDIACFKHASRDCVYDEAMECAKLGLDDPEIIIEQAKYYEDHEYAKHKGLCEAGFMIRRNNERTRRFNEAWWADYCRFSRRDQLSFMPAVEESGVRLNSIIGEYEFHENGTITRGGIIQIANHENSEGNFNGINPYKK